ncbi:MAG TPA: hypothetical protein VL547_16795 [Dinghuibacter sp.]|uniref:hypothetical protein n=1 Tax=Dinghuibacter sp. TaxID=2024697 RepID=UPI002C450567|nr:hypothetical protein [Dinghuibacter sp.]HTJ13698.1 hypothetical protein [Dinghuibacter sp.]
MKKTILLIFLAPLLAHAQNTFPSSGNVGIGTNSPYTLLEVKDGIDLNTSSTQYTGSMSIGLCNDFAAGGAQQYILLIPQATGTPVAAAGLSGTLREYRGNSTSFNDFYEYEIVAQTAYQTTYVNVIPRSVSSHVPNVYSVNYGGTYYLALLASDMILSAGYFTYTGYFWNNINGVKPQLVPASSCSNIAVAQPTTYIAGSTLTANSSGFVGVGTPDAQSPLHVVGPGTTTGDFYNFKGDLSIQANTATRSTQAGPSLQFVLPASADGSNPWAQGRIMTVAGNTNSGDATGKMILSARSLVNVPLYGNQFVFENNIVIDGSTGNVGIGTLQPQSLLAVAGRVTAKEVMVDSSGWADFVFDSAYRPMPLQDVASYTRANKHLPDIPSSADIAKGGLNMGDMQKRQMQKIEELTLYAIEADKKIGREESLLVQMQARLEALQAKVDSLTTHR